MVTLDLCVKREGTTSVVLYVLASRPNGQQPIETSHLASEVR
jgi:hypothetical protein